MKESNYKSYDELPLFLNAATVAKVLGIAPSSSYELMHEKDFPTLRIGNRIVVPKEAFIRWVEQHTGADELGTERAQAACQHAEVEEGQILGRVGDQADQRHGEQQHQKAQPNGGRTVDKDAGLVVFLIKAEPDDCVGHAQTDHRYKQVCGLLQQA